ncbi:MAG: polysaccharide deacetylase family protein [Desulfopila sp.]
MVPPEGGRGRRPLSPAEWFGIMALLLSPGLWPLGAFWAAAPLTLFLLACAVMPFCPTSSFFLPVIGRGRTGQPLVSLTFDDGPTPTTTPLLLDLLDRYQVSATFFVVGERAERHPEIIGRILAAGHGLGNHSYSHDDCIMFRSVDRLVAEIEATQEILRGYGVTTRFFRPPVGILTPRYADALHRTGLLAVNFSRRARDMGNRRLRGLAERTLRGLTGDDIILLHDTLPPGSEDVVLWLTEVEAIICGAREKGVDFAPLATLVADPPRRI